MEQLDSNHTPFERTKVLCMTFNSILRTKLATKFFFFDKTLLWNNALLLDQFETIRANSIDIEEAL